MRKDKMNMIKKILICAAAAVLIFLQPCAIYTYASEGSSYSVETNEDGYILVKNDASGYEILVDDEAGLLSHDEEKQLVDDMKDCSDHGFILFVSADENSYGNVESYAQDYYRSRIPDENGVMLLIDMDTRKICVYSEGDLQHVVTNSKANIITDNIYTYAHDGDYYTTARIGFEQISDVLNGRAIAQPMKYISNACLAILIALIINYFFARGVSSKVKPTNYQIIDSVVSRYAFSNPSARHTNTTKTYSPRSESSSGGGGGRSGGGGGGGHSSGSHSF
ncbi:MAG: TPM domain-containing protein [Lachnospiraceae bacterium]|nr:TPM domain-containing protein [Lachnospiraceae bacterium]